MHDEDGQTHPDCERPFVGSRKNTLFYLHFRRLDYLQDVGEVDLGPQKFCHSTTA